MASVTTSAFFSFAFASDFAFTSGFAFSAATFVSADFGPGAASVFSFFILAGVSSAFFSFAFASGFFSSSAFASETTSVSFSFAFAAGFAFLAAAFSSVIDSILVCFRAARPSMTAVAITFA